MGVISNLVGIFSGKRNFENYISKQATGINNINNKIESGEITVADDLREFKEDINLQNELSASVENYKFKDLVDKCEELKDAKIQSGIDVSVAGLMERTGRIQEQEAQIQKIQRASQPQSKVQAGNAAAMSSGPSLSAASGGGAAGTSSTSTTAASASASSAAGNQAMMNPKNANNIYNEFVTDEATNEVTEQEEKVEAEEKDRDDDDGR